MTSRVVQLGRAMTAILGALSDLHDTLLEQTGHGGIVRVSLTPEAGLRLGIAPGTSVDVATSAGMVEVYAERAPRAVGLFHIAAEGDVER